MPELILPVRRFRLQLQDVKARRRKALYRNRSCSLITLQDVVGYLVGSAIGLHPLLALQCSSSAMSGGVGTASAFGPIFENMGAPDATTVGVAAGTMGNIMGSLIGGPASWNGGNSGA